MSNIRKFGEFGTDYHDVEAMNEGKLANLWQTTKNYMARALGRYKVKGEWRPWKKGAVRRAQDERIQKLLDNSNQLVKQVYACVKKDAPKFPNDTSRRRFLRGVANYGIFYQSIVAATKKDPKDPQYLDPNLVNLMIKDLREIVRKHAEVDLLSLYTVLEKKQDMETDELILEMRANDALNEEIIGWIRRAKNKLMDKMFGSKMGSDRPDRAGSRLSGSMQKTSGKNLVSNQRMRNLESNVLPLILMGVGGTLASLGWLIETNWFKEWILRWLGGDYTKYTETQITQTIDGGHPDEKGLVHWMSEISKREGGGEIKTAGDIKAFIENHGGTENLKGMFVDNGGGDPAKQAELLHEICSTSPANTDVWTIFTKAKGMAGTMKLGQNLFGISKAARFLFQKTGTVIKEELVKGQGTIWLLKLLKITPFMKTIGLAIATGGVILKMLREKGQRQSRLKTLDDLLQMLQFVEVPDNYTPPPPPPTPDPTDPKKDPDPEDDTKKKGGIYPTMIKNLTALRDILLTSKYITLEGQPTMEDEVKGGKASQVVKILDGLRSRIMNGIYQNQAKGSRSVMVKNFSNFNREKELRKVVEEVGEQFAKSFGVKDFLEKVHAMIDNAEDKQKGKVGNEWVVSNTLRKDIRIAFEEYYDKVGKRPPSKKADNTRSSGTGDELKEAIRSMLYDFDQFLVEKGGSSNPNKDYDPGEHRKVSGDEEYLTQAVVKLRKSVKMVMDDKDKIGVTPKFIDDILDEKMLQDTKKAVMGLYKDVYEYLRGKFKQTLPDFDRLYKENVEAISGNLGGGKRQMVAEKMARFYKRSSQFENEGFYGGLSKLGGHLKTFNVTMVEILDYYEKNKA